MKQRSEESVALLTDCDSEETADAMEKEKGSPAEHQRLCGTTLPSEFHNYPTRTYTRRWLMLALFAASTFMNAFQWIHLNILDDVLLTFYNASLPVTMYGKENAVDWLSMVYMIMYVPFVLPVTWILNKKGLRFCCIIGAFFNAMAACIKCAGIDESRFYVLMVAQVFGGAAQVFILGMPARISAVWFGPRELASATSIGVFGNQLGVAVGFLLPPVIVTYSFDQELIATQLSIMLYGGAGCTCLIFVLMVFFFENAPPHPPSYAQLLASQSSEVTPYSQSLRSLLTNAGFLTLTLAYGLSTAIFYALATLMNPMVLSYFPGEDANAGLIGLTLIVAGVAGALVAGLWVDKTAAYKSTTVVIYSLSLISMAVLTATAHLGHMYLLFVTAGSLESTTVVIYTLSLISMAVLTATAHLGHMYLLFVTAGSLGFFMTGYLPVGFEYAAELTFPASEGMSSGIISLACMFFGMIFTVGLRGIMSKFGALCANITMTAILGLATFITFFISSNYRRRKAIQLPNIQAEVTVSGHTRLSSDDT